MSLARSCVFIFLIFFLSSCDFKEVKTLRVGISPWPGYEPLALAAERDLFDHSVRIRIVRFNTPTESYRALRDGVVDVAAFTADEVFHFAEVREKPRMFLILDISNGADAIVARPEIQTLDDLKGKRLGVEGSALGDYLIKRTLDFSTKLRPGDLILKSVEINEQERAYLDNEIDAAVTYEPSKSLLINAGAHVLFDSSKLPNEIVDVLVTNEHIIEDRADDLEELARGWFKVLDYINNNYDEAMHAMARHEATTPNEFQAGYEDLIIPSRDENIKMLVEKGSLYKPMRTLAELMYQKGSLTKKIEVGPLLDSRIVQRLEE